MFKIKSLGFETDDQYFYGKLLCTFNIDTFELYDINVFKNYHFINDLLGLIDESENKNKLIVNIIIADFMKIYTKYINDDIVNILIEKYKNNISLYHSYPNFIKNKINLSNKEICELYNINYYVDEKEYDTVIKYKLHLKEIYDCTFDNNVFYTVCYNETYTYSFEIHKKNGIYFINPKYELIYENGMVPGRCVSEGDFIIFQKSIFKHSNKYENIYINENTNKLLFIEYCEDDDLALCIIHNDNIYPYLLESVDIDYEKGNYPTKTNYYSTKYIYYDKNLEKNIYLKEKYEIIINKVKKKYNSIKLGINLFS